MKSRGFLASGLSTYDFSTLYTTLPHNLIKEKLTELIEQTFNREGSLYLACNDKNIFFLFLNNPNDINRVHVRKCVMLSIILLALIFNETLAWGDVPDEWRQANISPVFKKGEKYDAGNYRQVSLTCICCKTLEHILVSNINKHLALDSILADCQHGFRSQRSCETQLV